MRVLRRKVLLFIEYTKILADELGTKRDVHVDSGCLCAGRLGQLFGPLRDFIQFGNNFNFEFYEKWPESLKL